MSDKVHNSLSSFMKKQINQKSSKNSSGKSSLFAGEGKDDTDKKDKTEEELEQEKALEEAKKAAGPEIINVNKFISFLDTRIQIVDP